MKSKLELLKEKAEVYTKDVTSEKELLAFLRMAGTPFENVSEDYGYFNIRFYCDEGGYVRICKGKKDKKFRVQMYRPVKASYSGIPTFEPSGKKSF